MYRKEIKEAIKDKKYAIITEDMDSVISLALLQSYNPKIKVIGFVNNYVGVYWSKLLNDNVDKTIGLDLTLYDSSIDTISNHVENVPTVSYSNGITCNKHITNDYGNKSVFSTTLMLWSALERPLPTSKMGKVLLLCIDSTYLGWFNGDRFKENLRGYLLSSGLGGLIDVLDTHPKEMFDKVTNEIVKPKKRVSVTGRYVTFAHDLIQLIYDELDLKHYTNKIEMECFLPTSVKHLELKYFNNVINRKVHKVITYARTFNNRVSFCYVDNFKLARLKKEQKLK